MNLCVVIYDITVEKANRITSFQTNLLNQKDDVSYVGFGLLWQRCEARAPWPAHR